MAASSPDPDFLLRQIRWAMGRGLPGQDAEDAVYDAWERAQRSYDPARGDFETYMHAAVRNACAHWWRRHARTDRAHQHLRLVPPPPDAADLARAESNQQALLDALSPEEREVFAAWALQKHLGKGRIQSDEVAASIGLTTRAYENAKRRLKDQLGRLLGRFGWSVADVFYGEDHVDQTG